MKPSIFVARLIPSDGLDMLKELYDVEVSDFDGILTKQELIAKSQNKDVLLSLLTDTIDEEFINSCPNLKMISNYAVGYNNIEVPVATAKNIVVTNTPGTLDDTTADLAFTLLMAAGRRLYEADKFMRAGNYKYWGPMDFLGQDITGATLGIIGMGRVGKEVAKRAYYGFKMKIIYVDRFTNPKTLDFEAERMSVDDLLKKSDFVSLHVPLNNETHHLISDKELKMMKKSAYLINTSRGPVIDEKILLRALQEKWIAGAGLDVYEEEPKFVEGLGQLDNIIMLPHIGSASIQTRQRMSRMAAQNIIDFLEGRHPKGLINKELMT